MKHNIIKIPHRGCLNILESFAATLFHKIKGESELPEEYGESGEVISHLSTSLSVLFNHTPSANPP